MKKYFFFRFSKSLIVLYRRDIGENCKRYCNYKKIKFKKIKNSNTRNHNRNLGKKLCTLAINNRLTNHAHRQLTTLPREVVFVPFPDL